MIHGKQENPCYEQILKFDLPKLKVHDCMWCSSFGENLPHVTMVGYDGHRSNMEQALPQLCCTWTTELENKSGQILKLCEFEAKEMNVKPLLTFM